jgi:hypothetical protein
VVCHSELGNHNLFWLLSGYDGYAGLAVLAMVDSDIELPAVISRLGGGQSLLGLVVRRRVYVLPAFLNLQVDLEAPQLRRPHLNLSQLYVGLIIGKRIAVATI